MAGLKSIMTRPVFSRSRRQADATTSTSISAIGGEGDGGIEWEPVVWQVAVIGVVGAAALLRWYMARGRDEEEDGQGKGGEERELMAELEVRAHSGISSPTRIPEYSHEVQRDNIIRVTFWGTRYTLYARVDS